MIFSPSFPPPPPSSHYSPPPARVCFAVHWDIRLSTAAEGGQRRRRRGRRGRRRMRWTEILGGKWTYHGWIWNVHELSILRQIFFLCHGKQISAIYIFSKSYHLRKLIFIIGLLYFKRDILKKICTGLRVYFTDKQHINICFTFKMLHVYLFIYFFKNHKGSIYII